MDTTATVIDALDWGQTELTGSPEKAPAAVVRPNECLGNLQGVPAGDQRQEIMTRCRRHPVLSLIHENPLTRRSWAKPRGCLRRCPGLVRDPVPLAVHRLYAAWVLAGLLLPGVITGLSLGKGWHHKHHAFPSSARHGLRWEEIDPSDACLCARQAGGLVRGLGLPATISLPAGPRQPNKTWSGEHHA